MSNAHHPKHDIDIDLVPDLDMIDGLRHGDTFHHPHHEIKQFTNPTPSDANTPEKVSAWIYPKLHQEITGRPDGFLGGCEIRVKDCARCRPKKIDNSWLLPKEQAKIHPTDNSWRPKEWLVAGTLSPTPPTTYQVRCFTCEEEEADPNISAFNGKTLHTDATKQVQSNRHPEPIPIPGHPVKDSPFLRKERMSE